jgi:hypothetical protein
LRLRLHTAGGLRTVKWPELKSDHCKFKNAWR